MASIKVELVTNEAGAAKYLSIFNSSEGTGVRKKRPEIRDILYAAEDLCQECLLLSSCEPRHQFQNLEGFPVGVAVKGNKINLGECLLRSRGLTPEDIYPSIPPAA